MAVTADISGATKHTDRLTKNLGRRGLNELGKRTKSLLLKDARSAFVSKRAPSGYPWKGRKSPKPWALLHNTGKTLGALRTGLKVKGTHMRVTGYPAPGVHHSTKRRTVNLGAVVSIHHYGAPHLARRPIFGISKSTSARLHEQAKRMTK